MTQNDLAIQAFKEADWESKWIVTQAMRANNEGMSEQEKFEAQGRAHAALKAAKSNVATLAVSLRDYAQALHRLSQDLDRFMASPSAEPDTLQRQLRELGTERAVIQLGEYFAEAKKVQSLQEQINQF